jgi:hypothetical protein
MIPEGWRLKRRQNRPSVVRIRCFAEGRGPAKEAANGGDVLVYPTESVGRLLV